MYALLTGERWTKTHPLAVVFTAAFSIWIVRWFQSPETVQHEFEHHFVASGFIAVFILFAMKDAKLLDFNGLFDYLRYLVYRWSQGKLKKLFFASVLVACMASAGFDNVTGWVVMSTLIGMFFVVDPKTMDARTIAARLINMMVFSTAIVIAVNIGGVASAIGDATTFMIWQAGKISFSQLVVMVLPSAIVGMGVSAWLLSRQLEFDPTPTPVIEKYHFTTANLVVITLGILSFVCAVLVQVYTTLPALVGMGFGVGVTTLSHEWFREAAHRNEEGHQKTHEDLSMSADAYPIGNPVTGPRTYSQLLIERALAALDWVAFLLIFGLLLAVGGLETTGNIERLSELAYGHDPSIMRLIIIAYFVGILSAVIDNVPIAAILLVALHTTDPWVWAFHIWGLGVGGSLLLLGSLPGILMMTFVGREVMTYGRYLRIGTIPAFAGYNAGFFVMIANYQLSQHLHYI